MVGNGSRGHSPVFATLNSQSTCHGPRPGPTVVPSVHAGLLRAPQPRAREKPPGGRAKSADVQETSIWNTVKQGSPSGCGRLEIPGVPQVTKGEHRRSHVHEPR